MSTGHCACRETSHEPRRVVITGGPGAGKTALLELVQRHFREHSVAKAMTVEPSRKSARSRIVRIFFGMLAIGGMMVACSSGDDADDDDAGSDGAFDRATPPDGDADAASDSADESVSQDGGESACVPSCTSSQVCCVDEHGHFPRCADSTLCTPPLRPPDGGG